LATAACLLAEPGKGADQTGGPMPQPSRDAGAVQEMTLEDCLRTAMQNNHRRRASKFAVVMAEAQHRQALAGYWPQISGKAGYLHLNDACVVTRCGFQTMVELNPQVGRQLKTLVSSPAVVPIAFLFRADYSSPVKDQILAEIEKVHSTAASQQVLTLFQGEALEVCPVSSLDTALDLLAAHAQLSAQLPPPPSQPGGPGQ